MKEILCKEISPYYFFISYDKLEIHMWNYEIKGDILNTHCYQYALQLLSKGVIQFILKLILFSVFIGLLFVYIFGLNNR